MAFWRPCEFESKNVVESVVSEVSSDEYEQINVEKQTCNKSSVCRKDLVIKFHKNRT